MVIQIGVGNEVTTTLNVSAKTLTFAGAYNFDIVPSGNFSVYSTTASKYVFGGDAPTRITAASSIAYVAGLPVQTITFSEIVSGVSDGDTLVIFCDCPEGVATYNSIVTGA